MPQDPDDRAYVPQPQSPPSTQIYPNGSVSPFNTNQWTGTYAVSNSLSTAFNQQVTAAIWIRSISIIPLSSTISVAFFFRYGNWFIGTNPPVVNTTLTISGFQYEKDFKDGTGRYPQLNTGDTLQLVLIASGDGYVTVDIDAELVYSG